ncbi:MAG TPA: hypothetical protein VMM93_13715 [Vicinamibacterales bacterium]|nr:hypothetical protein [Vicinamibacterales bacterium]
MTFNTEVVLKGRDFAVTHTCSVPHGDPGSWDAGAVRDVLAEILRAIERAGNPDADPARPVILQGFSWIVQPADEGVVIAIEIPMGAAVAGPFPIGEQVLDGLISRAMRAEPRPGGAATVH